MRIATSFLATAAALALVACSTTTPGPSPFSPRIACTGPNCVASVTVDSSGAWCKPKAIADIDLRTGGSGAKSITWTLDTEGYEFSRESYKFALFIKNDPFDEFKDANVTGNGRTLTIKFNGQATGRDYQYAITVRRSGGAKAFCETLDPWLIS